MNNILTVVRNTRQSPHFYDGHSCKRCTHGDIQALKYHLVFAFLEVSLKGRKDNLPKLIFLMSFVFENPLSLLVMDTHQIVPGNSGLVLQ